MEWRAREREKGERWKIRCLFYLIGGASIGQVTGKAACRLRNAIGDGLVMSERGAFKANGGQRTCNHCGRLGKETGHGHFRATKRHSAWADQSVQLVGRIRAEAQFIGISAKTKYRDRRRRTSERGERERETSK